MELFCSLPHNEYWNQQGGTIKYQNPPDEMIKLVDMKIHPLVSFPPGYPKEYMLLIDSPSLLTIDELSRPEYRLAGYRFNPITFTPSRMSFVSNIQVMQLSDAKTIPLINIAEAVYQVTINQTKDTNNFMKDSQFGYIQWAPNGKKFTFCRFQPHGGLELWLCDIDKGSVYRLLEEHQRLHAICESPVKWFADSQRLLIHLVPYRSSSTPTSNLDKVEGPHIQFCWDQKEAPARTFADLLTSTYDAQLLEYYCTNELLVYDTLKQMSYNLSCMGCFTGTSISPNDQYVLLEEMIQPFSYSFPASRFPRKIDILDISNHRRIPVAHLPLQQHICIEMDAVTKYPRSFQWRADTPATLCWVQALDEGDPKKKIEFRDALYLLDAPFSARPQLLLRLNWRLADVDWSEHHNYTMVWEEWLESRSRRIHSFIAPSSNTTHLVDNNTEEHKLPVDRTPITEHEVSCHLVWNIVNWEDRYQSEGYPISRMNSNGKLVLRTVKRSCSLSNSNQSTPLLYLVGSGASDQGDEPFLDFFDPLTHHRHRLWQSQPPYYEKFLGVFSENEKTGEISQIIISKESPKEIPNIYIASVNCIMQKRMERNEELVLTHSIKANTIQSKEALTSVSHEGNDHMVVPNKTKPLTYFQHPFPSFLQIQRQVIEYFRKDGVRLFANLFLPPLYDSERDGPLPTFIWAYPREYLSSETAGQLKDSPWRFIHLARSPLYWLTQGYAVLDGPEMPIIGCQNGERHPNDEFIPQLVASAQAAVDYLVNRGISDPKRIAIGGHSYGAFMTVNLLAHAPELFCCGIARSGAYNRTLTPFGFQMEDRNLWQVPKVYMEMSPFLYAHQIQAPLLLIHGELDNNDGTHRIQSERMFLALKGLGKISRLVILPKEAHHCRARESMLHVLYEMHQWLETFTKSN
eukprot:jgi/Galph1/4160/GphlegSOOS_G2799.1